MTSYGIFETLESQYENNLVTFPHHLEEHYAKIKGLDDRLVDTYNDACDQLGLANHLDAAIELDRDRELHLLQSDVGDDEYTTTDSISLGPALIGFGPVINGIKISWKDTGVSKYVGNYAEGWVITPPSAEATFEVTNRRHARSGVPFVLDPIKLKLLSPVRKQSQTWDLDLESKLEQLASIASWTDRSWFTYDYHQLSLILANVVFDFQDAKTFPYLFATEGGCGGPPPYGNLDTVYSALHYYTRGKSRQGILGVMEETVAVNTGSMAPKDTYYLRNSHLANLGDKVWLKYESAYRTLIDQGSISRTEAEDLLRYQEDAVLPENIRSMGVEIEPHSFAVGASLSALRKEGLIMSEMDVKVLLDSQARQRAVLSDEPIGVLNNRLKEEFSSFKGKHLKILSQISETEPRIYQGLRDRGMLLPQSPGMEYRSIAMRYFSLRTEEYARYSSLFYTDTIRIFRTDEIRTYIEGSSMAVRADFARTESLPKWSEKFLEENREERIRRTRVLEWFNSKPLSELLYKPLPPDVGTDDSRVAHSIIRVAKELEHEKDLTAMVVVLFSGDRQLARLTTQLVRGVLDKRFRLLSIDRSLYTRICLAGVQEYNTALLDNRAFVEKPWMNTRLQDLGLYYYNYILKRPWPFPESIISQIKDMGDYGDNPRVAVHVEYDYPNMERGLDCIRLDPRTGTMEEYGGGYLERRTLESFARHECWAKQGLDEIYSWPDFDLTRSKRHYPLRREVIRDHNIQGYDVESLETYSKVSSWRKAIRPGSRKSWRSSSNSLSSI